MKRLTCVCLLAAQVFVAPRSTLASSDPLDQLNDLAKTLAAQAKQQRVLRLVVADLSDLEGRQTQLARFLAEELSAALVRTGTVRVMERQQFALFLHERRLPQAGLPDPASLKRIGKEGGIDGIIAGTVIELDTTIRLTAKMISTMSGDLVATAAASLPKVGILAELSRKTQEPPAMPEGRESAAAPQTQDQEQPEDMVLVPAGPFLYGEGTQQQTIRLPAFWIDPYEVTNEQYAHLRNHTYEPHKAGYPVTDVSWNAARIYCKSLGKRLPTEQEWEKAARGTDGRLYPWGNTYEPSQVNAENRLGGATSVGRLEEGRSPYGLYDMAGNVMEWTDSGDDQAKVFRGGSWASSPQDVQATSRNTIASGYRLTDLGFRCAKDGPRER